MFDGQVIYRQYQDDADRSYVCASWIKSLRSDRWADDKPESRDTYNGRLIDRLLAVPDTLIFIACLADEPDTIVGYCVGSRVNAGARSSVLHFVYVRKQRRREGIARRLLQWCDVKESSALVHTFQTSAVNFIKHRFPTSVYVDPESFLE